MQSPFRFGVQMWESGSGVEWKEKAQKAERLGYDILVMPDHFGVQLAFAPALAVAAAATTTLRVGTLVLDNDFRHPALVANDAATLDLLSDGRFELGLGAGWMQDDYDRSGISFEEPAVRVRRFRESVRVIKGLLTATPVTFMGRHYTITDLTGYPKPVQHPHPPILIGAGSRQMLTFAAREADIISILPSISAPNTLSLADLSASVMDEKIRWVREAAGERFDALELHALIQRVIITDDRQHAAESLGADWGIPVNDARESPYLLIGTVEEIADMLCNHRERFGLSYLTIFERDMEAFAPVIVRLAGR